MNFRQCAGLHWLIAVYLSLVLVEHMTEAGFDLNELPEMNEQSSEAPTNAKEANQSRQNLRQPTQAPSSPRKTVPTQFYEKVLKLFQVLEMCDKENFNLNNIRLPDSFAAQNKAIMALNKIAKANLIRRADKARFNRLMKNCLMLSKAVHAKTESMMSIDSQMSGGTYEDRMKRLRESPLDDFRERFRSSAVMRIKGIGDRQVPLQSAKTMPPRELRQETSGSVMKLAPQANHSPEFSQSRSYNFIQFL